MVSVLSILCMAFSLLLCLALTFGLFLFLRKRLSLKVVPMLAGAAAFILFVFVLEWLLHSLVLKRAPDGSIELARTPWLYVLYGTLAAGLFEETARFIAFKLLRRKYDGFSTAISYGIGHGGIEVLLITALATVNNLVIAMMINAGMADALGDAPQVASAIAQITGVSPWMFTLAGIERIPAVAIQISLSVLVWHGVNTKGRLWLYPAAIVLHALADVPATMYQCGALTNVVWVEVWIALFAAALVLLTIAAHKRLREPQ